MAAVRSLWGSRVGFDVTAQGEGQWYGDLVADGARLPGAATNVTWFGLRARVVAFPF